MESFRALSVLSAMIAIALFGPLSAARAVGESGPGSGELPRYRLKVGQELKYHGTSDFKYQNGSLAYETDWTFWVVRANDDGSWRVIGRSSSRTSQSFNGQKANEQPPDVTIAYFDLHPDGRVIPNKSFGYRFDPSALFPGLPRDTAEESNGWQATNAREQKHTEFKAAGAGGSQKDEWVFEGVDHGIWDKIYLMTSRSRDFFDKKRGVIKRVETENTQDYGFHGKGSGTLLLTSLEEQNPDQIKALDGESMRYFEANQKYDDLVTEASKDTGRVKDFLAQAETTLKDARAALSVPVFRDQLDEQLKNHARMASYYTEEAKNRDAVVGHVAADWETKDLTGKPHSLKDYRGKVVILDFWYRGCGWCIRAMPQMKELADDFKGRPVAVLGMNTDRDEKDAKFVVDELGLNYPVLKAQGVPEKYHVRGFPTLIIIDQEGKVADIHVGYSPTLREEVGKAVKGLLARR
jgi:peroxiredoxin